MSDHFGELRSALHGPPGLETWRAIGDALDAWDDPATLREVALPYAHDHLSGWPAEALSAQRPATWDDTARLRAQPPAPHLGHALLARVILLADLGHVHDEPLAAALRALTHPWVRKVRIRGCEQARSLTMDALIDLTCEAPHLDEIDWSSTPLAATRLRDLLEVGELDAIRTLRLSRTRCGDEGARLLGLGALMPSLRALDLSSNALTPRGVDHLQPGSFCAHIEDLNLSQNPLIERGAAQLAALPLRNLRTLRLSSAQLGPRGVALVARAPFAASLRRVDLSSDPLGAEGVSALRDGPLLDDLEALNLSLCRLPDEAARQLTRDPRLSTLRELNLSFNALGDDTAVSLAQSPHTGALRTLRLSHTHLSELGVGALLRSETLRQLDTLDLRAVRCPASSIVSILEQSPPRTTQVLL